jgi:hypothetical protein
MPRPINTAPAEPRWPVTAAIPPVFVLHHWVTMLGWFLLWAFRPNLKACEKPMWSRLLKKVQMQGDK